MFPPKNHIFHTGISHSTLRKWQSINSGLTLDNLMYPVFIIKQDDAVQPIESMPGVARYGINKLKEHLESLVTKGLQSILIFGVVDGSHKDECGSFADSKNNPVMEALPKLRKWFPDLLLVCDVCLCPYTSHGHCGILNSDGSINNPESIKRIAQIAFSYAEAGAHVVAPSDMMDGRIGAIKDALLLNEKTSKVSVLSYTAKFASCFYGPFRDAAQSKPAFGDRKCYQLPPGSGGLAVRAATRDVIEGADMLMVKPGLPYLDIVKQIKQEYPHHPLFVYQVSGEYAMMYNAAQNGTFDLRTSVMEVLSSMRRAGADVIITYFVPLILDWLELKSKY